MKSFLLQKVIQIVEFVVASGDFGALRCSERTEDNRSHRESVATGGTMKRAISAAIAATLLAAPAIAETVAPRDVAYDVAGDEMIVLTLPTITGSTFTAKMGAKPLASTEAARDPMAPFADQPNMNSMPSRL